MVFYRNVCLDGQKKVYLKLQRLPLDLHLSEGWSFLVTVGQSFNSISPQHEEEDDNLSPKTEKITLQVDPWLMSLIESNIQHNTKNKVEIFECVPDVSSYLRDCRLMSAAITQHKQWIEEIEIE